MTKLSNNNPSNMLFRRYISGGIIQPYVLKIINDNSENPLCTQELVTIIHEKTSKENPEGNQIYEGFNLNHGFQFSVLVSLERDGLIYSFNKTKEEIKANSKPICYWQITTEGKEKLKAIIEDCQHPFMENLYNLNQIAKELFE